MRDENMSKAGKRIMAKREADSAQNRTSQSEITSSLPESIPTPDCPTDVPGMQTEGSGSNTPSPHTEADPTPSSGVTPNGVSVKIENPWYSDEQREEARARNAKIEEELRKKPLPSITQEFDCDYDAGTPYVPRIDLDDFVAGEPLKPGPLTMEDAYELGKLTVENFAPPTGQPKTDNPALHVSMAQDSEGKFPKFVNPPEGRDRDELISALKKAKEKTVFMPPESMPTLEEANEECRKLGLFDTHEEDPTEVAFNEADPNAEHGIAYWMEKETSDGETPDMAQVHEGAAQGGGAEAGLGDEECSSDGSGDCQDDAEQVG